MVQRVRVFLTLEVVIFVVAAAVHFGLLRDEQRDVGAAIAESVIAAVLFAGLATAFLRPAAARTAGIAAQAFALVGTCIGLTLVLTVGPTKGLDLVFHGIMLPLLITGLATTIVLARDARAAIGDTA